MTVYAELLKMALAEQHEPDRSVDRLVSEVLTRREALRSHGDAASRLAVALAYDSVLVRLCDALGVAHELTGEQAGPQARRKAERALSEVLPTLAVVAR
ncbi:MAG TPA: hypothetical protein VFH58_09390 [Acidimicrobiales bacterium]|nr:hypothetical protein [Acidimicrobiales bacterium]